MSSRRSAYAPTGLSCASRQPPTCFSALCEPHWGASRACHGRTWSQDRQHRSFSLVLGVFVYFVFYISLARHVVKSLYYFFRSMHKLQIAPDKYAFVMQAGLPHRTGCHPLIIHLVPKSSTWSDQLSLLDPRAPHTPSCVQNDNDRGTKSPPGADISDNRPTIYASALANACRCASVVRPMCQTRPD